FFQVRSRIKSLLPLPLNIIYAATAKFRVIAVDANIRAPVPATYTFVSLTAFHRHQQTRNTGFSRTRCLMQWLHPRAGCNQYKTQFILQTVQPQSDRFVAIQSNFRLQRLANQTLLTFRFQDLVDCRFDFNHKLPVFTADAGLCICLRQRIPGLSKDRLIRFLWQYLPDFVSGERHYGGDPTDQRLSDVILSCLRGSSRQAVSTRGVKPGLGDIEVTPAPCNDAEFVQPLIDQMKLIFVVVLDKLVLQTLRPFYRPAIERHRLIKAYSIFRSEIRQV